MIRGAAPPSGDGGIRKAARKGIGVERGSVTRRTGRRLSCRHGRSRCDRGRFRRSRGWPPARSCAGADDAGAHPYGVDGAQRTGSVLHALAAVLLVRALLVLLAIRAFGALGSIVLEPALDRWIIDRGETDELDLRAGRQEGEGSSSR